MNVKKKVVFTVDVEGHVGLDPVSSLIYGKTKDGRLCGIDMIMDLLDEFDIIGIFFVDIAEAWSYGMEAIAGVMCHIKDRGHIVGVHIHPDHMADRSKMFLAEYTYQEQYEIIKKCTVFYYEILGEMPLYFRAGKYGANWDTLDILGKLGYKADFSEFYGQKWCKIEPPCTYTNIIKLENGLIEIPVNSYRSFDKIFYSRFDKIDAAMPYGEFKIVVDQLIKTESYDIIVLFAHSFSLLNWRNKPNNPCYSKVKYKRLYKQLEYVIRELGLTRWDISNEIGIEQRDGSSEESFLTCKGLSSWIFLLYRCGIVMKSRIDVKFRG